MTVESTDPRLTDAREALGLRTLSRLVRVDDAVAPTVGQVLTATADNAASWSTPGTSSARVIGLTLDGGGSAITAGNKGFVTVPFSGTITGWTLLADQVGSIVIDVWSDAYGSFPPTVADTIAGSEKPTLASAQKAQDVALTTWDVVVTAGDVIAFNVEPTPSGVTRVTLTLTVQPS